MIYLTALIGLSKSHQSPSDVRKLVMVNYNTGTTDAHVFHVSWNTSVSVHTTMH